MSILTIMITHDTGKDRSRLVLASVATITIIHNSRLRVKTRRKPNSIERNLITLNH